MIAGLLTCLNLLACTGDAPARETTLRLPELENAPAIDGCIHENEWKGATEIPAPKQGRLLLARRDGRVFVGADPREGGIVSIYLMMGRTISVLHASYSIGTAEYAQADPGWKNTRSFEWERPEIAAGKTSKAVEANFAKRRWSGTRTDSGCDDAMETMIDESLLSQAPGNAPVRVAISFFSLKRGTTAWTWPADLTDSTTDIDLQKGDTPALLEFGTENWVTLRADSVPKKGDPSDVK